jgi:hypothetical protein
MHHNNQTKNCSGAAFTRLHHPTGRLLKRLGTLSGTEKGDGPERDETLRWMRKLGPERVRGWKFVRSSKLTQAELQEVENNIRELFDLCRICGKEGHFAARCPLRSRSNAVKKKKKEEKGIHHQLAKKGSSSSSKPKKKNEARVVVVKKKRDSKSKCI